MSDSVALQRWIPAAHDAELKNWKTGDFNSDNRLDSFDLCLMKRELLNK